VAAKSHSSADESLRAVTRWRTQLQTTYAQQSDRSMDPAIRAPREWLSAVRRRPVRGLTRPAKTCFRYRLPLPHDRRAITPERAGAEAPRTGMRGSRGRLSRQRAHGPFRGPNRARKIRKLWTKSDRAGRDVSKAFPLQNCGFRGFGFRVSGFDPVYHTTENRGVPGSSPGLAPECLTSPGRRCRHKRPCTQIA